MHVYAKSSLKWKNLGFINQLINHFIYNSKFDCKKYTYCHLSENWPLNSTNFFCCRKSIEDLLLYGYIPGITQTCNHRTLPMADVKKHQTSGIPQEEPNLPSFWIYNTTGMQLRWPNMVEVTPMFLVCNSDCVSASILTQEQKVYAHASTHWMRHSACA